MRLRELLTEKELLDIEDLKDITENSSVDDIEIFCYARLHEIIAGKKSLDCFSNEELLKTLMQMKSSIDFFNDLGFIDTNDIMSTKDIYRKVKQFFLSEIKARETV